MLLVFSTYLLLHCFLALIHLSQAVTFSSRSSLLDPNMATQLTANCPFWCTICCKGLERVGLCLFCRSGSRTCSRLILPLLSLRTVTFQWETLSMLLSGTYRLLVEEGAPAFCTSVLEDFTSTVLSTFAARSDPGPGVSSFCAEMSIGITTIPPSIFLDRWLTA